MVTAGGGSSPGAGAVPGTRQQLGDGSSRRRTPRSRAAPPAFSPGGGEDARPPSLGSRSPERSGAPPGPGSRERGAGTGEPGGAGAVYTRGGGAAYPQVRRPGRRRSLHRLFGILAWVARFGAAPRDRRSSPLGKRGTAAQLPGLPRSWVLPVCGAWAPAASPVPPASAQQRGCLWSEPVVLVKLAGPSVEWTPPALPPTEARTS